MPVGVAHDLDLARMRAERFAKLQGEMGRRHLGALLLSTSGGVLYASGAWSPPCDTGRTYHERPIVLVVAGETAPHLFTPYPEGAPPELPADHLHRALWPESAAGVEDMAARIGDVLGGRAPGALGVDDYTFPMWAGLGPAVAPTEVRGAGSTLAAARLHKTADELECMRRAWRQCEAASAAVEAALRPGVRLSELTGVFLERLFQEGATCNFLDPVFQAMPDHIADGPWSTNGDVPFALVTNDSIVRRGDLVWTDTVTGYEGYASDVGRTWVVGEPTPRLRSLFARWREITDAVIDQVRPGATGADLTRVATEANGGTAPWLAHYFLGHTLGLEGGEPQRVGSDLGAAFDEQFVLEAGMAVVLEPVTWEDGHGGYRCEELLFVTDEGHELVSAYPHHPFE